MKTTTNEFLEAWDQWIDKQPLRVASFIRRNNLKPGDMIGDWYFFGCLSYDNTDDVGLIVTSINPLVDYDGACEARVKIRPRHIRQERDGYGPLLKGPTSH